MLVLKNTIRFVLLCIAALFTQYAIADTKIHEVQPYPIEAPEQLVVWGTNFGDNPEIFFGTHPDPLVIDVSSPLCDAMRNNPAPPIAPTGFDCVVTDLPSVNNGSG